MIPFLLCAIPLLQELPAGLPHPTLPAASALAEDGLSYDDPGMLWVTLSPPWLLRELATPALRAEAARPAARRMGMDEARVSDWLQDREAEQVDLRYRLSSAGEVLLEGRERVLPGMPAAMGDWFAHAVVLDVDVEIASSAAIADPVAGFQWGGYSLPVAGLGWVAECALTQSQLMPAVELPTGYADIRGLARLSAQIGEVGFATLLLPGAPALLKLPGATGAELELQLQADAAPPRGVMPFGQGSWIEGGAAAGDESGWERLRGRWSEAEALVADPYGFVLVEGLGHEERAAAVLEELQAAVAPLDLRLTWTVEREGKTVATGRVELPTLAGRELRFASGTLTRVLADWQVEVALDSRIADPVLVDILSGVRGALTVERLRAGMVVDLDLEFTALELGEQPGLLLGAARPAREGPEAVGRGMPEQRVKIDAVQVGHSSFRGRHALDGDGRVVLERSASAVYGPGAVLQVVVEAGVR